MMTRISRGKEKEALRLFGRCTERRLFSLPMEKES